MDDELAIVQGVGSEIDAYVRSTFSEEQLKADLMRRGRKSFFIDISKVKDHSYLESWLKRYAAPLEYNVTGRQLAIHITQATRDAYWMRKKTARPDPLRVSSGPTPSPSVGSTKRTSAPPKSSEAKKKRIAPEENNRQQQDQWSNVAVHLLELDDDQAATVGDLLHSCGGRVVDMKDATHILVREEHTDLQKLAHNIDEAVWRRIVSVNWLNEVMFSNVSPMNFDVAKRFQPRWVLDELHRYRTSTSARPTLSRQSAREHMSPESMVQSTPVSSQRGIRLQSSSEQILKANMKQNDKAVTSSIRQNDKADSSAHHALTSVKPSHNSNPCPVEKSPSIATQSCTGVAVPQADVQRQMTISMSETMEFLKRERPEIIEANQLRFAINRSLQDFAIQVPTPSKQIPFKTSKSSESDWDLLGVTENADLAEVRAAYRAKALQAHPDKGGDPTLFHKIHKAYRVLQAKLTRTTDDVSPDTAQPETVLPLPRSKTIVAKGDFDLRNHRELVRQKFEQDGVDLSACIANMNQVIASLDLKENECGATNKNERGEIIYNQCFYLSLSSSYLGSFQRDLLSETALNLKRLIEAAVLAINADWEGKRVGEDVQAFSDFLYFALGSCAMLSELAVAVFDSCSGCVEIYVGRDFPSRGRQAEQRSNLLTILYVPGHYRALVPLGESPRPCLSEVIRALESQSVHYVTTYV